MTLPRLGPLTRWDLVRFDVVHALPIAWGVLRRRFGPLRALSMMARYLGHSLRDPLRAAPQGRLDPRKESLTRHQLRAAMRLDDALRGAGAAPDEGMAALREVVGNAGAAFIASNAPLDPTAWRGADDAERERYAGDMLGRFPNAHFDSQRASESSLDFDVTYCRLAELCREMDRPHLAPLFCFADAVYFEGEAGLALSRDTTIAAGDDRCRFRIHTDAPGS